jgi:hypothetical protein
MRRRKFLVILLVVVFALGGVGSVFANSGIFNDWKAAYPSSSSSAFSCSLCHTSPPALNGYGAAVLGANFNFASIESGDSDGDGATNIAEINAGTNPGDGGSTPAPAPVACTDYEYSAWSACDANGQQTRTQTGLLPANCTGTPSAQPVLTQSCTPPSVPVACTDYEYSAWSACDANGQQTRTQTGLLPANCTGTPSGQPLLTQVCNYVPPTEPPTPPSGTIPVPTGAQIFSYQPIDLPVVSDDPAQAKPIGVGPIATGGNTIDVKVDVGPFDGPMDVSLVIYAPAIDFDDIYFMGSDSTLKRFKDELIGEEQSGQRHESAQEEDHDGNSLRRHYGQMILWKKNVTDLNESIYSAPVSDLPSGLYTLVLVVSPDNKQDNYYRWITYLFVP